METTKSKNAVHTNEVSDIISSPPSWTLKWGLVLLLIIMAAFGKMSSEIIYPELLPARAVLSDNSASLPFTAPSDAKIISEKAIDGVLVKKGQILFDLQTAAGNVLRQESLLAPTDGRIIFLCSCRSGALIRKGTPIFYLTKENPEITADLFIPQNAAGQIKKGQSVRIIMDRRAVGHPIRTQGIIESISTMPEKNYYIAKVNINSSYRHELGNGQTGKAQVTLDNHSLWEKLVSSVKKSVFQHE